MTHMDSGAVNQEEHELLQVSEEEGRTRAVALSRSEFRWQRAVAISFAGLLVLGFVAVMGRPAQVFEDGQSAVGDFVGLESTPCPCLEPCVNGKSICSCSKGSATAEFPTISDSKLTRYCCAGKQINASEYLADGAESCTNSSLANANNGIFDCGGSDKCGTDGESMCHVNWKYQVTPGGIIVQNDGYHCCYGKMKRTPDFFASCEAPTPAPTPAPPAPAPAPECFPGDAMAEARGRGPVALGSLELGDRVLVRRSSGHFAFEPVLSFLHAVGAGRDSAFLAVAHELGELRVSANHLVFVAAGGGVAEKFAADLEAGDELVAFSDGAEARSRVRALRPASGRVGMFAPLTASGTIVVDGVVASNYANVAAHAAAHAAFFPARFGQYLGLLTAAAPPTQGATESMDPLATLFHRTMKLTDIVGTM